LEKQHLLAVNAVELLARMSILGLPVFQKTKPRMAD
jgi:hypothetical protein